MKRMIFAFLLSAVSASYGTTVCELVTVKPDGTLSGGQTAISNVVEDVLDSAGYVDKIDLSLGYSQATFNYMNGNTNCWFSGTNYVVGAEATNRTQFAWLSGMDWVTVPCSLALWEIRDGQRQCVWDQRDWTVWYWNYRIAQYRLEHNQRDAALSSAIAGKAPLAWSSYTACGVTNAVADTTWFDTPKVTLSAGFSWQHQLTAEGVGYWGIVGNGFSVGNSASETNSVLRITDWEGNDVLKIRKGSSRLAFIDKSSNVATGWDDGYMWFDMNTGGVQPVGEFSVTLSDSDFVVEGATCPATVREYEARPGGIYRCYFKLKSGIVSNCLFARFKIQTGAETTVEYMNAPTVNGLIVNGKKIAPEIPANAAVGTVITWKVVQ